MEPNRKDIYAYEFAKEAAGWLYYLAPRNLPRNADIIMKKAMETFCSKAEKNCFGDYAWTVTEDGVYDDVKAIFEAIPEFVDLNLSENEIERGVKVDDEDRPKFAFHTRYDVNTEESLRDDFIDPDAFVQNVVRSLYPERNIYHRLISNENVQSDSVEQEASKE